MSLEGLDEPRRRYLNLSDTERITLLEVARYEAGPMPPFGAVLLDDVQEWTDLSEGTFWDYGVTPLIEGGLIDSHKDGNAKRYTLSDEGKRVLAAGRDQLDEVLEGLSEE